MTLARGSHKASFVTGRNPPQRSCRPCAGRARCIAHSRLHAALSGLGACFFVALSVQAAAMCRSLGDQPWKQTAAKLASADCALICALFKKGQGGIACCCTPSFALQAWAGVHFLMRLSQQKAVHSRQGACLILHK